MVIEEEGHNAVMAWAVGRNRGDKGRGEKSGDYCIHPGLRR